LLGTLPRLVGLPIMNSAMELSRNASQAINKLRKAATVICSRSSVLNMYLPEERCLCASLTSRSLCFTFAMKRATMCFTATISFMVRVLPKKQFVEDAPLHRLLRAYNLVKTDVPFLLASQDQPS